MGSKRVVEGKEAMSKEAVVTCQTLPGEGLLNVVDWGATNNCSIVGSAFGNSTDRNYIQLGYYLS